LEWIKIDIFLLKGVIVSPWVFCVLLLMAAVGYFLVHKIVNRKWGYTLKREKEWEEGYSQNGSVPVRELSKTKASEKIYSKN